MIGTAGSRIAALMLALSFGWAGVAQAQGAPPTRVRATIDAVTGDTLDMTTRTGDKVSATLTPDAKVSSIVVTKIDEIKPNSFIGVTSAPQMTARSRRSKSMSSPNPCAASAKATTRGISARKAP